MQTKHTKVYEIEVKLNESENKKADLKMKMIYWNSV